MAAGQAKYKRVLLKLSGEALHGEGTFAISHDIIGDIAAEIKEVHDLGVELAIVTGGGNFFRGVMAAELGIDRASADYMGMLATMINGIALQNALEKKGLHTRLVSALEVKEISEPFIPAGRSAIWKKAGWSFSPPGPAILFSPPTRPPRCGPSRSRPIFY
jgi:uridylate kinase